MSFETLIVETHGRVGVITLNRPQALNALCDQLTSELDAALSAFDADPAIGCMVLTGSAKAFAAGADIKEMQARQFPATFIDEFLNWGAIAKKRKPIVAAVAGYALGGGCEIAMMCDVIIAADNAKFGQPEIKLGVTPGAGGTQRLTRLIGRAKAMDLCLTGRMMDAAEAERSGLVSRVVPAGELLTVALDVASTIAAMPLAAVLAVKECIKRVDEVSLEEGLLFERRAFHSMFATHDQKEGMAAFAEKRAAKFENR
jgi:enoyl-CoA hydratase